MNSSISSFLDDSGNRSLAGFFYQIFGTANLTIELLDQIIASKGNVDSIFALVAMEAGGEDAIGEADLADNSRVVEVVEFKYSSSPEMHPILPSELFEIFTAFERCTTSMHRFDSDRSKLRLITNRQLSQQAKQHKNAAVKGAPSNFIDEVIERRNGGKVFHKGRSKEGNPRFREFLNKLQFESRTFEDFIANLRKRAAAFGVLEPELSAAVPQIVGSLFQRGAGPPPRRITSAELDNWLTADKEPRPLRGPATVELIREGLRKARGDLEIGDSIIRREMLDLIRESATSALIQLSGPGGSGKTVAALSVLDELAAAVTFPPPFVAIGFAEEISDKWIGDIFCRWRHSFNANFRGEEIEQITLRLIEASKGGELPALVLVLDGLDEVAAARDRGSIIRVLRFFESEHERCKRDVTAPRARLIVTCRDERDMHDLYLFRSGFRAPLSKAHLVNIGDFTDRELRETPDSILPPGVAERIRHAATAQLNASRPLPESGTVPSRRFPQATLGTEVDPVIYEAIRHPTLCGCLNELDHAVAHDLLTGKTEAIHTLSTRYLDWFYLKANRRNHELSKSISREVLETVARHRGVSDDFADRAKDWSGPTRAAGLMEPGIRVFDEACSAGLILQDGKRDQWRWRNPVVCASLSRHTYH